MPGYDPQQTYRDAVNYNQMRYQYIAGRMENGGYEPSGGGGCGCLGTILALIAVLFAFSIVTSIAIWVFHIGVHVAHFFG